MQIRIFLSFLLFSVICSLSAQNVTELPFSKVLFKDTEKFENMDTIACLGDQMFYKTRNGSFELKKVSSVMMLCKERKAASRGKMSIIFEGDAKTSFQRFFELTKNADEGLCRLLGQNGSGVGHNLLKYPFFTEDAEVLEKYGFKSDRNTDEDADQEMIVRFRKAHSVQRAAPQAIAVQASMEEPPMESPVEAASPESYREAPPAMMESNQPPLPKFIEIRINADGVSLGDKAYQANDLIELFSNPDAKGFTLNFELGSTYFQLIQLLEAIEIAESKQNESIKPGKGRKFQVPFTMQTVDR
jgi:hypothetical protein